MKGINYTIQRKVAEPGFPMFLKLLATHRYHKYSLTQLRILYAKRVHRNIWGTMMGKPSKGLSTLTVP